MKKRNPKKTVILGMSGGVDSSVAALLLKNQGYKVIGVFMKNFSDTKNKYTGECWWRDELNMAAAIANRLDIEFHILDYEKEYKNKVIKPMIKAYSKNKTPNPDIDCNNLTKFPSLMEAKKKFEADLIATGHYAKIKKIKNRYFISQSKDKTKDQSYFLYKLTQKELSKTIFPLGNLTKEEVRKIAKSNNFPNWDKHGSAGVCFIGNVNLGEYLKQHIKVKEGKVIDDKNNMIGTHDGTTFYTIGQKAGSHIGINIDKPSINAQLRYYIARKLPRNILQVAPEGSPLLESKKAILKSLNAPSGLPLKEGIYKARYRHLGPIVNGKLSKKDKFIFTFDKPQKDIASGQSLVLYKKDVLIAGGEML